jgi:hypothetical protein
MKRTLATLILALSTIGCIESSSQHGLVAPLTVVRVSGIVTLDDGTPVWMAKVTGPTQTVYTNPLGVFRLTLARSSDTVTLRARDGYTPGVAYAVTHFGSTKVSADRDRVVGIVLRYTMSI